VTDCKSLYYACLIFSIQTLCYTSQVWIFGEKIGEGIGKTRKEAQCQAADTSLRNLAGELMIDPPFFLCSVGVANVQRNWGGWGVFL